MSSHSHADNTYKCSAKSLRIEGVAKNPALITQQLQTNTKQEGIVFSIVEQMPQFPGGVSVMNQFIKSNLVQPKTEPKLAGRVLTSFVVNVDGSIQDITIIEGMRVDYSEEAIRIISLMPRWKPGRQSGKDVRVRYRMSIGFEGTGIVLQDGLWEEKIVTALERWPEFPGGVSAMYKFIDSHLIHPTNLPKLKGKVLTTFIVDTDGSIENPTIVRSLRSDYDEASIQLIKTMPKWIPGQQSGRNIRVRYALPITFN